MTSSMLQALLLPRLSFTSSSENREEAGITGSAAALHALLRLKTASVISGGSMKDMRSHSNLTQLTTDWTMVGMVNGEF